MQTDLFEERGGGGGGGGHIDQVALHRAARSRYLNYALSVITSRALPDVRDGLKPVQRRILYAMYNDLRLRADSRCLKSARVVGEVMGKYHPHGDQSIYDAMVRLAQGFSLRYPLVDGQGNFGSIDGDRPAAMRYTESKLLPLAQELLAEIDQQTIDIRSTYDGQLDEPVVLPAQIPNLLINGAAGIAVGLATNIPPHNLGEVVRTLVMLIDDPDTPLEALLSRGFGPDFPTGGEILTGPEGLHEIYETGQGPVKVRGTWTTEVINRRRCIIITSIPYGLNKATLVEKIAQLIIARKVPQLLDVRDESTDTVRVVLELKRGSDPDVAMAFLHKHTPLQQNFHVNLTCLVPTDEPGVTAPARIGLRVMLRHFLDFRLEVVVRRLGYQLDKLRERIHILEGFAILFDALDEAIDIIRNSRSKKDAAKKLMAAFTGLDAEQTDHILELRLYRLARMEVKAIREELAGKRAGADRIEALLADGDALWGVVRSELIEIAGTYGDERRTALVGPDAQTPEFDPEAYIVRERTWVIVSRQGRIKRQGGFSDLAAIRLPDGDEVGWAVRTDTRQTITLYTQLGSAYTVRAADIVATTGFGEPVQTFFSFADGERVVGVTCSDEKVHPVPAEVDLERLDENDPKPPFAVAVSRRGKTVRFAIAGHSEVSNRNGRRFMGLAKGDGVVAVVTCTGGELMTLATEAGRVLIFPVWQIPPRAGAAKGVKAIRLMGDDRVLGFQLTTRKRQGLRTWTSRGREIIVRETTYRPASRGGKGTIVIHKGELVRCEWPPEVIQPSTEEDEEVEGDAHDHVDDEAPPEPPQQELLDE